MSMKTAFNRTMHVGYIITINSMKVNDVGI